jgi:hypothetical protein
VVRWRVRYDQGDGGDPNDLWDHRELELADGRRVLIGMDLCHSRQWWLLRVLAPSEHLVGRDGGRCLSA